MALNTDRLADNRFWCYYSISAAHNTAYLTVLFNSSSTLDHLMPSKTETSLNKDPYETTALLLWLWARFTDIC